MTDEASNGVWICFMSDYGIHNLTIHATEIEALRTALMGGAMNQVQFVEFGSEVSA